VLAGRVEYRLQLSLSLEAQDTRDALCFTWRTLVLSAGGREAGENNRLDQRLGGGTPKKTRGPGAGSEGINRSKISQVTRKAVLSKLFEAALLVFTFGLG